MIFTLVERALGVEWPVESDTFGFRIILQDQPLTQRGILSTTSFHDIFLLGGNKYCKISVEQSLVRMLRLEKSWENWRSQLRFSMECCLKPTNFGTVVSRQIHGFSDASPTGYDQETYMRIMNEKGDIHCAFLMGKARVLPVKTTTTPRIELIAAAVSVQVGEMITRELEEPVESKFYRSDSTTVLKYMRNVKKLFHVFVDMMRTAAIQLMMHHVL